MILPIKKEGDPVLREPTEQVVDFDFEFQTLVNNMIETMRANNGVGLAAPQVGVSKRILVCEFTAEEDSQLPSFPLTVLCNPRIKQASKEEVNMVEGCLSVPDREILVKRPKSVTVVAQDRYGNPIEIDAESIFARVVQHEIDHLNSTLIVDHVQELNVMFIGTGSLGEYSLRELIADTQYHVNAVITGEAKATIRGQAIETNTIAQIAHQAKIPLIRTERIRDEAIIEKIKKINPDLIVMADFGQIIPKEILNIPRFGVLNIHPSLLPRHRGPSPIQQTILDGDKMAGVSLMLTVPELDAGPVIAQTAVELIGVETSSILKDYLGELGAALLLNSLPYPEISSRFRKTMKRPHLLVCLLKKMAR